MLEKQYISSDKITAAYAYYTCSIQFLNCLYFLSVTIKDVFSWSQIDCTSLVNQFDADEQTSSKCI